MEVKKWMQNKDKDPKTFGIKFMFNLFLEIIHFYLLNLIQKIWL